MNAFAPYRGENSFVGIPAGNAFSTNTGKPVNAFDPRFNFLSKLGELGNTWYQRLLGEPLAAIDRVGGAMLGQNRYPIDEINDPATVRMKQAQDVLEAVGLYSGPSVLAGKPSLTGIGALTVEQWAKAPKRGGVAAAALKMPDGHIVVSRATHGDAALDALEYIEKTGKKWTFDDIESGFVDNSGNWLTRSEVTELLNRVRKEYKPGYKAHSFDILNDADYARAAGN